MRNLLLPLFLLTVYYQLTVQLRVLRDVDGVKKINDNHKNGQPAEKLQNYHYEIKTFEVPIDHFNLNEKSIFKIRYFINTTWQKENNPPIFFYTGNQEAIELYAHKSGFMWEIAKDFQAVLVFAEHRYYGQSEPFGNDSYSSSNLRYLTVQQTIADYVDLVKHLRSKPKYERSPVIAFGASYGGMLSAWMRMKYPTVVQGAIASSAPLLHFTGIMDCSTTHRIITSDYRKSNSNCPINIRKSWDEITKISATDDGKKWISETFKLCTPLKSNTDIEQFKSNLINVMSYLPMVDYPYPAHFATSLPANPLHAFCKNLSDGSLTGQPLLIALQKAVNGVLNYTGESTCMQYNSETSASPPSLIAWTYQTCTEMVMPICRRGDDIMFESKEWNLKEVEDNCFKKFQVRPKPYLICEQYGCTDLSAVTNVVFSNGMKDPWYGGGVLKNVSDSAVAILIPEGAHAHDLLQENENDPYGVIEARKYHRNTLKKWIREYKLK
ncbi:lysosomal Pro-X carboxypeptidase-like [Prorops nasuta]|uniref:lysosomal Pro-X carboxypeptidase-like n=1 Tax=Prorops nasuta TaxID=863751 RepID=UPI0034CE8D0E